jgi:bile acid:Na+ symporter, BASS family
MSLDRLINIAVTLTLIEMMVTVGLRVSFSDIAATAKDLRLVIGAAVANYVVVPAVAVALLLLFNAKPMVAAGFLVLAVCPGAPFGPPFTAIARGNVATAVGLMVILAGSSAILSPLLLQVLLPWLSPGEPIRVDLLGIIGTLVATQLLPLLVGLSLNHWRPRLAAKLLDPCERASKIMNLGVAALILATQFQMLIEIRLLAFGGMLVLLVASLLAGWLGGGPDRENRKTLALTTALRNAAVGLVIATGNFAGTPAVSAVLAYGIVAVFGTLAVAVLWGRYTSSLPAHGRLNA